MNTQVQNFLLLLAIIFFTCNLYLFSQSDSSDLIPYSSQYKFNDGLFLSIEQVKKNSPIPKENIILSTNTDEDSFYKTIFTKKTITIKNQNAETYEVVVNSLWGYAKNGSLFIYWNNELNRIMVVGSICHFVATEIVQHDRFYDPYNPYSIMYSPTYSTKELRQYMLDFESGKVFSYTVENLLILLMRDVELYDEYSKLKNKQKRQMMFVYIRKYNEKHPLMLPKK